MDEDLTLTLDACPIRFTPDGKISVIDAIKSLTGSDSPELLWESLKGRHPEILAHCEDHCFQETQRTEVVDGEGWEKIGALLFEHMITGRHAFFSSK
jgi:hypothetical protein